MNATFRSAVSILQCWPKEVWEGAHYQQSQLSPVGMFAKPIDEVVHTLPPASMVHPIFSPDATGRLSALQNLALKRTVGLYVHICTDLMNVVNVADSGYARGVNPILRRSLLALRDVLVPPCADGNLPMRARLDAVLAIATRQHHSMRPGSLGYGINNDLLMMVIGLHRVVNHPAFASYDLEGPTPKPRRFALDALSLLCFLMVSTVVPVYIGATLSVAKGVSACVLGICVGSLAKHSWEVRSTGRNLTLQPSSP